MALWELRIFLPSSWHGMLLLPAIRMFYVVLVFRRASSKCNVNLSMIGPPVAHLV